jgi:ATP-dependent Clp protease ATP-binding subunit ClpA
MMFERFTHNARQVVVQAQHNARRLGHNYIGTEHLLLAAATLDEPASAVLREQGVTPERIEAQIASIIGSGHSTQAVDPLYDLDRDALAAIGIDLDVVRTRIEAAFGPDAFARAIVVHKRAAQARRRPAWGKGPVAELNRRWRRRRTRRHTPPPLGHGSTGPRPPLQSGQSPPRHIPFTPRAKKSLEAALREAKALNDNYIGVQHLILALVSTKDGLTPRILSGIGASPTSLHAAILTRYRKAS